MTTANGEPTATAAQSAAFGRSDHDGGAPRRPDSAGAIIPAERTGRSGLSHVDPALVERMRHRLRAQTADCVMDTFGISVNTWVKMRDGKPIRTSVARRFLERMAASN